MEPEILVVFFIMLIFALAWGLTLRNILKTNFLNPNNRIAMTLVIILLPFLGLIIYWIIRGGLEKKEPRLRQQPLANTAKTSDLEDELYEDGWREMD